MVVDVTGDGLADIVGFGDAGVLVGVGDGTGHFGLPILGIADFGADSAAGGWDDVHRRFVVDVTGDGQPDIVGIRDETVWVATGLGDGTFAGRFAALTGDDFGGGKLHLDYRMFFEDVDADGHRDLIMVGKDRTYIAKSAVSQSAPFEAPYAGAGFGHATMKNIHVADVTGDGRAEIFGALGHDATFGFYMYRSLWMSSINADGRFGAPVDRGLDFLYSTVGYDTPTEEIWAVADMNGDGFADLVGSPQCRDYSSECDNVYFAYSQGDGDFDEPVGVFSDFGQHGVAGWYSRHSRFAATFTTSGHADIVGFGKDGTYAGIRLPVGGSPVPDVRGKTVADAAAVLAAAGFTTGAVTYHSDPTCNNIGLVTFQTPIPGTIAAPGSAVNLSVGAEPSTPCK